MQPSFTFTSRQDWNNLAVGLDSVIKTQLVNSHAKTPFDINLETAFYPNNVLPPPNELEVLDVKTVLPVCPPIYVQPSIAQGLQAVAIDDFAAQQITQVLSANNALKRGNIQAAEYLLKRPLTAEEIQNKSITPQVRQSESGQNYAVGPRAGPQSITGQAYASQEKKFGDLDVRFLEIARKLKLDPAITEATRERYNLLRPNPRNSTEATADSWKLAVDAVEQEVKNGEVALRMHVENGTMARGAIATLRRRDAAKLRNNARGGPDPGVGLGPEVKQREEKEPYNRYNIDYENVATPIQALNILDYYNDPANPSSVPNNPSNDAAHYFFNTNPMVRANQDSKAYLSSLHHNTLKAYALYHRDAVHNPIPNLRPVRAIEEVLRDRIRESNDDEKGLPMDQKDEPGGDKPAGGGPPGMDSDDEDPENDVFEDAREMEDVKYDDAPDRPDGDQSAAASGLGPAHPAPIAPNIPLGGLRGLGSVSLTAMNFGEAKSDEKMDLDFQLPAGVTDAISMLSNTAATVPQATTNALNRQIGGINLGGQPSRALGGLVTTGVPDIVRNPVQRINDIVNPDKDAAGILAIPAGSANRRRTHFRVTAPPVETESKAPDLSRPASIKRPVDAYNKTSEDDENEVEANINTVLKRMEAVSARIRWFPHSKRLHQKLSEHQNRLESLYTEWDLKQYGRRNLRRVYGPDERDKEEMGGDIGGGRIARGPRSAKRQRLDEKSRTAGVINVAGPGPNVTGISGFYGSTGPLSSNLMQRTGRDAVPVSGQIQVNENHQWTEAPLRQYIRQPQVVDDVVAEFEPIAINTQLRVDRPKASSVFERGHYGKYLINHIALEGKRTFSVSYPSSKKKVRGLPNRTLSDNEYKAVKKVLAGGIISASDKLTKEERQWMAGMHNKCGVPVHPGLMTKVKSGGRDLVPGDSVTSSLGSGVGSGALANVDPKQKIMDILGEMDAGNDNPQLKRQLAMVANMLFRRHQITPKLYADCKQHWS